MTAAADDRRASVLALLRDHGWNSTSFQVLEQGFAYWFDPSSEACVAYIDTGSAWVAAGAPIASELSDVGERFVDAARAARRRACFFAVEERFLAATPSMASFPVGEQPSWDPAVWPDVVKSERSLREQLRRARAKGVVVRSVNAEGLAAMRSDVEGLIGRWLAGRKMPPMGFIVDVQLFDFLEERRCFVAECKGRVVGLLVAVPVYRRQGWLFEDLIREPSSPNGTTELLFDFAMRAVGADGSRYVTLGLAPLAGDVHPWLRFVRACTAALYDFDGVRRFKAKLRPRDWTPIHLAWPRGESGNIALLDALAAFTVRPLHGRERASFVRFGIETLAHAPAFGVRVLAACLVPWTALLALAPTDRFFPSRAVQLGWVAWDVALVCALVTVSLRWNTKLARALALATSIDLVLTVIEAVVDGLARVRGPAGAVIVIIACVGPLLATSQLWGALRWRRQRSDSAA
jgi:lysylphosphatidylglycerol synthetase-like protein (DUF2156 family)